MQRMRVVLGDTHGYHMLPYLLKKFKNCDVYHVGDFGVGFISREQTLKNLAALNEFLVENDIRLFINRGNHDNPLYWKEEVYRTDNMWFVPSYTIVEETLFLGGAISIDRMYRAATNAGWWEDEIFVYDEICKSMTGVKDVISHTAPHFCFPTEFNGLVREFITEERHKKIYTLEPMLVEERFLVTKVYDDLVQNNKINTWSYGHFHKYHAFNHQDVKFQCIGISELKEF